MRAGELRHLVEIFKPIRTLGADGEETLSWTKDHEAWARIDFATSREALQAKQVYADATHEIKMRVGGVVTVNDRIMFGARIFNVLSVANLRERDIEYFIVAKEVL